MTSTIDKAYCLNETSKIVFNACNGKTSFDDLKNKHQFSNDLVYLALDGLKEINLLEGEYISPFAGISRREVVRKVGLASMIALPVISGLIAPSSATASSVCVGTGTVAPGQYNGYACSGICPNGACNTATCNCAGSAASNAECCSGISTTGVCDGIYCDCICAPPAAGGIGARIFGGGALPTQRGM